MEETTPYKVQWRGDFSSSEANSLHAEAFGTRVFSDEEWDWRSLVERHSLGWVVARGEGSLIGFVNVISDGLVHAWLQDTMVATTARRRLRSVKVRRMRNCDLPEQMSSPGC